MKKLFTLGRRVELCNKHDRKLDRKQQTFHAKLTILKFSRFPQAIAVTGELFEILPQLHRQQFQSNMLLL